MKIIRVKFLFVGFLFSFFFLPFLPEITSAASPPVIIWARSGAGYAYPQDLAITDTSDALYGVGSYSGGTNLNKWFIQKWDRSGNNSLGQPQPIWSIKDELPWQGDCTAGSTARDVAINTSSTDSKNGLFVVGTQSAPLVPSGVVKPDLLWRVERRGFDSSLKEWFPRDVVDHDVPPLAWNSRKNVAYAVAVLDSGDSANDGIYSTGFTNGGTTMFYAGNWYVEKRLFGQIKEEATQATPKLIGDGLSRPTAIAVDTSSVSGPGVYVFGLDKVGIRLEKRNLSTLALINSFGSSGNGAEYMVTGTSWLMFSGGMAIDDTGIYVSYTDLSGLHVERQQKDGKNFRWKETVPGSGAADYTYDLKVNSDGVYVTGTQNIGGVNHWRIEKRNKNTGVTSDSVGWEDNSIIGWPFSVGMDSSGVYSYGWDASQSSWRIEKRGLENTPPLNCALEISPPNPPLGITVNEHTTTNSSPPDITLNVKEISDPPQTGCSCQNVNVRPKIGSESYLQVTDPTGLFNWKDSDGAKPVIVSAVRCRLVAPRPMSKPFPITAILPNQPSKLTMFPFAI